MHLVGQLESLGVGALGHDLRHVLHRGPQVEVDHLQIQLPGLDFREVQDVVDHFEKSLRRDLHHGSVTALLVIQLRAENEFRHSQDAVHRRSDLVAHVGEEFALDPCGFFGNFLGFLQLGFCLVALLDFLLKQADQDLQFLHALLELRGSLGNLVLDGLHE